MESKLSNKVSVSICNPADSGEPDKFDILIHFTNPEQYLPTKWFNEIKMKELPSLLAPFITETCSVFCSLSLGTTMEELIQAFEGTKVRFYLRCLESNISKLTSVWYKLYSLEIVGHSSGINLEKLSDVIRDNQERKIQKFYITNLGFDELSFVCTEFSDVKKSYESVHFGMFGYSRQSIRYLLHCITVSLKALEFFPARRINIKGCSATEFHCFIEALKSTTSPINPIIYVLCDSLGKYKSLRCSGNILVIASNGNLVVFADCAQDLKDFKKAYYFRLRLVRRGSGDFSKLPRELVGELSKLLL